MPSDGVCRFVEVEATDLAEILAATATPEGRRARVGLLKAAGVEVPS